MISEHQLTQIYSFYKGQSQNLSMENLILSLGATGIVLSMKDQKDMELKNNNKGFSFEEFKDIYNQNIDNLSKDSFKSVFKNFDKENTGKILLEEFKYVMTTLGEKMSEEEFNLMLSEMKINPQEEEIDYNIVIDYLA